MPIYTYLCKRCNEKSDFLVGMTQQEDQLKCSHCGSENLEKAFALFGIFSKGGSSSNCSSCSSGNCSHCS